MRWMVRGDIDGFFGLALDNLVNLLLIGTFCNVVLGFSDDLVFGRVLPGVGVSLLFGNLFYAVQALRLSARTGRKDICALPYGINTPSVFAYALLVMLPAKLAAEAAGAEDPAYVAWQAGLLATLGSGAIEFGGAFIAEKIRRASPRAALLSTLSGIALGFISLTFLLRTFAFPVVGFVTLGIVLVSYFGRVKFRGGLPGGLVAVVIGTALAWMSGLAGQGVAPPLEAHWTQPTWVGQDILAALRSDLLLPYLGIIVPMGLFNVLGSLQNIEAAEAAGDSFSTGPSLAVNGIGTLAAAGFGSCFPTTIYIGHAGWKAMGARAGYSVLNGGAMTLLCLSGTLAWIQWAVPVEAGMAIILWIGLIITAQAFQATPKAHAPAVVLGILPGVAAWGAMLLKAGFAAGGLGTPERPLDAERADVISFLAGRDVWAHGAFALEQGFIFTAVLWAAMTVCVLERRFAAGSIWAIVGAALASLGLMHSYAWTLDGTVMQLRPEWMHIGPYAVVLVVAWGLGVRKAGRRGDPTGWFLLAGATFAVAIAHFLVVHPSLVADGLAGRDAWSSALRPNWPWVLGYALVALLLLFAPWITRREEVSSA